VVPIAGQSVAPVLGIVQAVDPGSVPISGQSVTPRTATAESVSPGAVAIVGSLVEPSFGQVEAVVAGSVPVVGQDVQPLQGTSLVVVAGAVPITGQNVSAVLLSAFRSFVIGGVEMYAAVDGAVDVLPALAGDVEIDSGSMATGRLTGGRHDGFCRQHQRP
jgi:hypothetical protein